MLGALPLPGMAGVHHPSQVLLLHLGVDLGVAQASVAEDALDVADVHPARSR